MVFDKLLSINVCLEDIIINYYIFILNEIFFSKFYIFMFMFYV